MVERLEKDNGGCAALHTRAAAAGTACKAVQPGCELMALQRCWKGGPPSRHRQGSPIKASVQLGGLASGPQALRGAWASPPLAHVQSICCGPGTRPGRQAARRRAARGPVHVARDYVQSFPSLETACPACACGRMDPTTAGGQQAACHFWQDACKAPCMTPGVIYRPLRLGGRPHTQRRPGVGRGRLSGGCTEPPVAAGGRRH